MVIDIVKINKVLNEVKPLENRNNNPQRFLERRPLQKQSLLPQNLSQRNCWNQLTLPSLSRI